MRTGFYSSILAGGLSVAASLPAFADITAQEVLDSILGYYESVGYNVSIGSEDMSGGFLTVKDMVVTMQIPEEDGEISVLIESFALKETGGGEVSIEIPSSMPLTVKATEDGEDQAVGIINYDSVNFEGLVSGDADDFRINTTFDSMSMKVDSLTVKGTSIPMTFAVSFGQTGSEYAIKKSDDDQREIDSVFEVEDLAIVVNVKEPGGEGFFSMTGDMADIASSGAVAFTMAENLAENPLALLTGGFLVDGVFQYGASNIDVSLSADDTQFAMTGSSTGGLLDVIVSPELIAYEVSQTGVDLTMSSSEIPFPSVKLNYDEIGIAFSVPLAKSDEPSDFFAKTAIRGLSVSEAIWSMIDPGQSIPRDPATVAIDLSGKVQVLVDLMDPETLENIDQMDAPPMLPMSLDLNELLVSFGGANLDGDGSVVFNFENPVMVGGVPLPIGEVNLSLKGGFGLMDKLMAIGLIPEDASMGIRAMLGAFAKPVGEDHFETKIEMTAEGAILANGQRIQ